MFTKEFWRAAGERAIKTWAQTLASVVAAGAITWGVAEWKEALLASVLAAALSVLTSIASNGVGSPGPSLGIETTAQPVYPLSVEDNPPFTHEITNSDRPINVVGEQE